MVHKQRLKQAPAGPKAPTVRSAPDALTRRGQRTRTALKDSARTVFARDGFHAARIADIAEGAHVAHGTFYTYFDSKVDVFLDLLEDLQQQFLGLRPGVVHESRLGPIERIARSNRQYLEAYRANGSIVMIWEEVARLDDEARQRYSEYRAAFVTRTKTGIERWQNDGVIDPTLDARYAANALTGMVSRFAATWFIEGESFELDEAVDQLTLLWANALGLSVFVGQ